MVVKIGTKHLADKCVINTLFTVSSQCNTAENVKNKTSRLPFVENLHIIGPTLV